MSTDRDLKAHAKLVAKDLKAGKATANTDRAIEFMGENPDAVLGVIGLIQQESNRKKPNQALVGAYVYRLEIIRAWGGWSKGAGIPFNPKGVDLQRIGVFGVVSTGPWRRPEAHRRGRQIGRVSGG